MTRLPNSKLAILRISATYLQIQPKMNDFFCHFAKFNGRQFFKLYVYDMLIGAPS